MLATLDAFWQKASLYMNLPKISITDIVEIIIIAFLIYYMLVWIKNTRAWMLLRGLMVILLFVLLAALFQMNTIIWIARNTLNVLVIALVVIFQPEMRKALENLGRKNVLAFLFSFDSSKEDTGKFSDKTINEMVKACYEMGKVKTGALIVVEDEIVLSEYERTGIAVDGILTSQLLINIFEKNTPLHDGAGISEVSDSLTIVVSEETGRVSIALGGELYRNVDAEFLKNKLTYIQRRERELSKIALWKRRLKDAKTARKNDNK